MLKSILTKKNFATSFSGEESKFCVYASMTVMKVVQFVWFYLFFCHCGANVYYVRHTQPTDTSCPAQPCLTLSQYISDSDLYFKSNTVFKFLLGLHHINQTLDMWSVENVSLEGEQSNNHPLVVLDMQCSSYDCAGFHFHNITSLVIHSLDFSLYVTALPSLSPNVENLSVSGFMYSAVNTLQMYHTSIQFAASPYIHIPYTSGITVFESEHTLLHSLAATFGSHSVGIVGIMIVFSQHTTISSTFVAHAQKTGILLSNSSNADIVNTQVYSGQYGLAISFIRHVTISNISVIKSLEGGIAVYYSMNLALFNTSMIYSGSCVGKTQEVNYDDVLCYGLLLSNVGTATLYKTRIMYSEDDGIIVSNSHNITIDNTTMAHVGRGIFSLESFDIHILCTTISNFSKSGIVLLESRNAIFANVTVETTKDEVSMAQSGVNGISIQLSQNVVISSTAVMHAKWCGILITSSHYVAISNTVAMYTQHAGVCIESSQYITLSSAVVMYAEHAGMLLSTSNHTDIVNAMVSHSGLHGVAMSSVHHGTVTNTSVTTSFLIGIFVTYSTDIAFFNTSVTSSGTKECVDKMQDQDYSISCFGLLLGFVGRAVLHNIQVMYAEDRGIGINSSSSITVKNAAVTQHSYLIHNN